MFLICARCRLLMLRSTFLDFLFEHTRKIRQRQEKEARSQSQRIARIQHNDTAVDMPLREVAARPAEMALYRKGRQSERKSSRFGFYSGKAGRAHSPSRTSANYFPYDVRNDTHVRLPQPQRLRMYADQQSGGRPPPMPPATDLFDEMGFGMKATIVDFKPGRDHFIGMLRPFVVDILEGPGPEALMAANQSTREPSKIRWIHLPGKHTPTMKPSREADVYLANNMTWVEVRISVNFLTVQRH